MLFCGYDIQTMIKIKTMLFLLPWHSDYVKSNVFCGSGIQTMNKIKKQCSFFSCGIQTINKLKLQCQIVGSGIQTMNKIKTVFFFWLWHSDYA